MKQKYIATFFNHFGAVRFKKMCDEWGWEAKMAPVPRALSSSCGTCVYYTGEYPLPGTEIPDEIEQIVQKEETDPPYICVYKAEGL